MACEWSLSLHTTPVQEPQPGFRSHLQGPGPRLLCLNSRTFREKAPLCVRTVPSEGVLAAVTQPEALV